MILSDNELKAAIKHRQIIIDPSPSEVLYTTTAVDLRLGGKDFRRWEVPKGGVKIALDPSEPGWFHNAAGFLKDVERHENDPVTVNPGDFLLALTEERIEIPISSRLAARVEGKSSLARIGLAVHVTAPTIHAGFKGNLALEIKNHGPIPVILTPGMPICQLIVELVFGTPSADMTGLFQDQDAVTGHVSRD